MANVLRLRSGLEALAFTVLGQPSAIVEVDLGDIAHARLMTRAALAGGALVNLVEHPAVSRCTGRWLLQVMADHTDAHVDKMIAVAVAAREELGDMPPSRCADIGREPILFRPENGDLDGQQAAHDGEIRKKIALAFECPCRAFAVRRRNQPSPHHPNP